MAAPSEGQAFASGVEKTWGAVVRSPEGTPQKVRQLIDEGIAPEEGGAEAKDTSATFQSVNGSPQAEQPPLESTSKEAFFSRVETFSSLKWAGKPAELSPLVCAKYGWVTVECDMLKCSSCQAFLCASLQPAFDFDRYKDRCAELKKALCTAHEKFCFWPDSPSPDRFGMLPLDEPAVLVSEFLDRFQSLCHLDLQLPSLRPEDLKTMAERSPGPIVSRTRSWDSSSPVDRPEPEAASPTTRTRPVTRSMGTGDSSGLEVPSSPLRRAKRARLCSSSSSDTSSRSCFDPTSQHRDWCPWVNVTLGKETREHGGTETDASISTEPGWKAVLNILLAHKQSNQPAETDSMSLSEKSRKVFRIFRQWESLCSS
ncbi:nuclear-interacting partner of ALK isoform X2 [Canis lupus familiaris]|uniref:nuclear-interacting partner of ALK isoform X2 n=1 Tax=Canis lupus familiaris TaxID=9615 RepID=UPI0003AE0BDA|nr:nuclear-interacting partner of ALK isoform X2 [Canis lupus familiaris]XP_035554504.1 zinc finger C3HC-type protein 1 isoform X2 [Canis lupus dingo]XP_038412459.1 nuclear-interacting partner of ALK isoform X2 [Canis lupus familiaris]XP_038542078.1 nuclear-interacting partner of ALK isoform X2 [Canis lupus familiaris]|eukprot:XP_005628444.1 nuclear-interacting partner of ALK isoform X2 [Canis lupus familiaris]